MFTGFQVDASSPRLPLGVRIIISLTAPNEEPFTIAITPIGVIDNYRFPMELLAEENIHPLAKDVISVEYTPASLAQRHIIVLPENQRLLIGNLPSMLTFDIFVERQFANSWKTTNRVLVITDGFELNLFQAKQYTKEYVPVPTPEPEPEIELEAELVVEPEP